MVDGSEYGEVTDLSESTAAAGRDPRFDLPVLAIGGLVTAGLSVGLATLLLQLSRASTGPNVGPTAATPGDAFSTVLGAALGLAVGSGASAAFAHRGSRMATGLAVGFSAYALVLVPLVVATGPSDVSAQDSFGFALILGVPLGIVVIVASILGAGLGSATTISRRTIGRRRDGKRP